MTAAIRRGGRARPTLNPHANASKRGAGRSRALDDLKEGTESPNGSFRSILATSALPGEKDAPRQRPYAAVLGCSDARADRTDLQRGPERSVRGPCRGNGLGGEVLGSLKYAIDHLGESLKLVVVLGHSGCGAVSAAVDVFLNPQDYLALAGKHSLRNILDRLLLVVHAAAKRIAAIRGPQVAHRSGYREALIEAAIVSNAALTAYTIQQEIGSVDPRGIHTAYGVYLLGEHQVWAPRSGSTECAGLAYPPADFAAFGDFADAVVRSDRIAVLLEGGAG
jgi:carbonic anhydrase